jgi:hypothetical protein
MVRRYLDHPLKVAASDTDQASVFGIVGQAFVIMGKPVEQPAERRRHRSFVC